MCTQLKMYKKFYEYFMGLYGDGLEVAKWHYNGQNEPLDNFIDAATEDMIADIDVKDLWNEFGDVPMNSETECIESEWNGFPAGTHREEIWRWFEEVLSIKVHDLMYSQ